MALSIEGLLRPKYSRTRVAIALSVAIAADAVQFLLGPLGWTVLDDVIDVVAMVLTTLALGFHLLFLPTFLVELVPIAGMLPTWTGCVIAVAALHRSSPPAV